MELKGNERIVDLERNGYCIIQDRERFCFGIDAVLLTGFAAVKKGEKVLDLGTGTGIPLHSDHWDFDEEILTHGVELYKDLIQCL